VKLSQFPVSERLTQLCVAVPDFRSSGGLFKSLKAEHKLKASGKQLFDASVYKNDDSTSSFHDMVRSLSKLAASAQPTAFHHLLARLAYDGRLLRLYTQNVDGIDTSLPPLATCVPLNVKAPWPRTIQLHGGLEKMVCQKCSHTSDFEATLFQGPQPPLCSVCTEKDSVRDVAGKRSHGVGKLRPRIVLYNEYNPDEEAIGSVVTSDLRARPDALIVVGTSLKIPGVRRIVREMCAVVRGRKHGVTIWINNDLPPSGKEFEDCWDLIVRGESDEVARQAALKNWNDERTDTFDECTASEVERVKENQGVPSVVVMTPKKVATHPGFGTPRSLSPPEDEVVGNSNATKNPASKGRSIANVLGKEKVPAGKAKITKKGPRKGDSVKQGLRLNFGVTKTIKPETTKLKNHTSDGASKPMVPLSPQAARNNGPLFPNLVHEGSYSPPWKDTVIVSPTGRVPSGMEKLLN
jgi:NAD+-dependent protein deacetylase SIR2